MKPCYGDAVTGVLLAAAIVLVSCLAIACTAAAPPSTGGPAATSACGGISREYPTIAIVTDGDNFGRLNIDWYSDGATLHLPKAFGFGGTRFTRDTVSVPGEVVRSAKVEGEHLCVSVTTPEWSGPNQVELPHLVAIPIGMVPDGLRPAGAAAAQVTKRSTTERRFESEDGSIAVTCPADWHEPPTEVMAALRQRVAAASALVFSAFSPDQMLNVLVTRHQLAKPMAVEEYYGWSVASMKKAGLLGNTSECRKVTIGGDQACSHNIDATTPDGRPMKSAALHLARGTTGWDIIVGGQPAAFERMGDGIDKILLSLELRK
jgi:hypothetical protein